MTKTRAHMAIFGIAGALVLSVSAVAVLAQQPQQATPTMSPSLAVASRLMALPGYLPAGASPDSLLLNPAPPAAGSPAEARDIAAANAAVALRGTPRWDLAIRDALLSPTSAAATFSCAAGFKIDAARTPKLDALLLRTARDLGRSTFATKAKYMRIRPFVANGQPMCTPDMANVLRADGSYPSGHSALGYGWSLILAEAIPDRTAQLVARGRAFGDSRRICNVHWLSDIEEGRIVASAVVARLNAEPAFQADLAAARAEAAAQVGQPGKEPGEACAAETALLAL
jgi:acid phosphatase (class A)